MPDSQTNLAGDANGPVLSGVFHDSVTVIQHLVRGYEALSTRYDGRVKNFLEFYLGTAQSPVPFGGRADSLQALDAWLTDDQSPHYALLAAPAGRGKSALLAQWVQGLANQDRFHIIYFPLSIRFNTNLEGVVFAALAARAAHLFGEQVALTGDAQQYRGLFTDFLRRPAPDGKPLLVVLDGLDEAAGWDWGQDVFPPHAPAHLRVLVAARPLAGDTGAAGWLSRLGWAQGRAWCPPLDPLTHAGVAEVLARMGNLLDALAIQFDVVAKLHALSEGDPLLVRLYVEALTQQGPQAAFLKPADLLTLQPGLGAYFDRWFAEQRKLWGAASPLAEKRVRGLLNLCAVALGPLSKDDLTQFAPDYIEDAWLAAEAARAVERFVIGDGVTAGYTYSHPRLNEYFAAQLGQRELAQWQARFVRYGRETLEQLKTGQLTPQATATTRAYALRHYAAHLHQTHAPAAELYALICGEWAQAWDALDSYAGFLTDLEIAWKLAKAEHTLAMQVRCAIFKSSIFSLSTKLKPKLLAQCVKGGLLTLRQALVSIQNLRYLPHMWERLMAITAALDDEQLKRALELSQTMGGEIARWGVMLLSKQALRELEDALLDRDFAPCLPPNFWSYAIELISGLENNDEQKAKLYCGLLTVATEDQKQPIALEVIHTAQTMPATECAKVIRVLIHSIPVSLIPTALRALEKNLRYDDFFSGLLSMTLAMAHSIEWQPSNAVVIGALLARLDPNLQAQVITATFDTIRVIRNHHERSNALELFIFFLLPEQLPITRLLANDLPNRSERESILRVITSCSSLQAKHTLSTFQSFTSSRQDLSSLFFTSGQHSADLAEAFTASRLIEDQSAQLQVLSILSPYLPLHLLTLTFETALKIPNEMVRAALLCQLTPHLPPVLLAATLEAANTLKNTIACVKVRTALVPHLATKKRARVVAKALKGAQANGPSLYTSTLQALAPYAPVSVHLSALEKCFFDDPDDPRKHPMVDLKSLSILAPYLPLPILHTTIAKIHLLPDESFRARAFIILIPHLPSDLRTKILVDAFAIARHIFDDYERAQVLVALAPHLPALLPTAIQAARAVSKKRASLRLLSRLAPHLSFEMRLKILRGLNTKIIVMGDTACIPLVYELIPYLPLCTHPYILIDIFQAIFSLGDKIDTFKLVNQLAAHLSVDQSIQAIALAHKAGRSIGQAPFNTNIKISPILEKSLSVRPQQSYIYWCEILHKLTRLPRPNFLEHFQKITPLTLSLVPEPQRPQLAADIAQSILDVAKTWP